MSGYALLRAASPYFHHSLQDDMESLVLVLLYCSVFWLQHPIEVKENIRKEISEFFEGNEGLKKKEAALVRGVIGTVLDRLGLNSEEIMPVRNWFIEVYKDIQVFYHARYNVEDEYGVGAELCLPEEKMWSLAKLREKLRDICRDDRLAGLPWFDSHAVIMGETSTERSTVDEAHSGVSTEGDSHSAGESEQASPKRKRMDDPSDGSERRAAKVARGTNSGSVSPVREPRSV